MPLFPEGGLDQSILVAVLVGVFVLLAFTEIFGCCVGRSRRAGLPRVGVRDPARRRRRDLLRGDADVCAQPDRERLDVAVGAGLSPFFGRERFFLIVLVSAIVRPGVRAVGDRRSAPARLIASAGSSLAVRAATSRRSGLVLSVPLLANMAWKLSLRRAAFQIGVSVLITWAIVVFVFLRFTNLSYSNLELTYENVALDFLGSPKAYIILLTTAFLAARFNLTYGWDYNGTSSCRR